MDYINLIDYAQGLQKEANTSSLAGNFSSIIGSFINYNALKSDLRNYGLQAQNVELQAKQQANQIRQQYIQAAGNYAYNAARRGISVNSGSVQSNLQSSAEAMGKDIQRLSQNASVQANYLRNQAKVAKAYGKAEQIRGITGGIMGITESGAKLFAGGI